MTHESYPYMVFQNQNTKWVMRFESEIFCFHICAPGCIHESYILSSDWAFSSVIQLMVVQQGNFLLITLWCSAFIVVANRGPVFLLQEKGLSTRAWSLQVDFSHKVQNTFFFMTQKSAWIEYSHENPTNTESYLKSQAIYFVEHAEKIAGYNRNHMNKQIITKKKQAHALIFYIFHACINISRDVAACRDRKIRSIIRGREGVDLKTLRSKILINRDKFAIGGEDSNLPSFRHPWF